MNAYDFDKTIYDGDSTLDFYFYCLRKKPNLILCLPRQVFAAVKYKAGRIDKTRFKEEFYCFFGKLQNMDALVREFWDRHEKKIKKWYRDAQKEDDLIISASPYFLLAEICQRIHVQNLIASEVDRKTGKYTGLNCYGEEKVRRFREKFDVSIENFYSDSKSDQPMADLAENKYLVCGEHIEPW